MGGWGDWGEGGPSAAPEFASSTAPEFAFLPAIPMGARTPKDDGAAWRNHGESPPPNKTISAGPNRGWESIAPLRHVREAVGPALVRVKQADFDPSVSAIRGPINRRGAARAEPCPWRREIMDNPPNRRCASRPPSRPYSQKRPPISGACTAPPRGPVATRIGWKAEGPLSAVMAWQEALTARRRINGVGNRPPFSALMALQTGRLARRRLSANPPPSPD